MSADEIKLLPCPFCGGPVDLEQTVNKRAWWGVVCRNTTGNRGGSCAVSIRPSASPEAAIERWNRRAAPSPQGDAEDTARIDWLERVINAEGEIHLHDGEHARGPGLGLRPGTLRRTLRAAIDAARSTPAKGGE